MRKRCEFLIANTGNAAQESYDSAETSAATAFPGSKPARAAIRSCQDERHLGAAAIGVLVGIAFVARSHAASNSRVVSVRHELVVGSSQDPS